MRREYSLSQLNRTDLADNPRTQFSHWFVEAQKVLLEPNAMALATATLDGKPSNRMVLFKGWDAKGLLFFTNYQSRKARELKENPHAAATFYWDILERQVCIEGMVEKVTQEISDDYFANRPRQSQLSSWASQQDAPLQERSILIEKFEYYAKQFEGQNVPRPPHWGGYRLLPQRIEFWQGRESRLHDRFLYIKNAQGWSITRLSP